jgi:hypothetical protein
MSVIAIAPGVRITPDDLALSAAATLAAGFRALSSDFWMC